MWKGKYRNMEKYRKVFNQYFKRFDIREKDILRKFHHSYRVMEYAKEIGKSLNFDEHDIWLCQMIGLFHDIGRFEQWTKYHTFWDKDSIDHGNLSYKIIQEEDILKEVSDIDKNIILTAVRYHNKYDLNEITDERIKLFCEIVRDADKLDILIEQVNWIDKKEKKLSEKPLKNLYEKRMCLDQYIVTEVDNILRRIGFIFDLNFSYSLKILKEKNWIENQFNILENYVEDLESVHKLKSFINEYVKEKIIC